MADDGGGRGGVAVWFRKSTSKVDVEVLVEVDVEVDVLVED